MKNVYITGIAGLLGANVALGFRNYYNVSGGDLVPLSMENVHSEIVDLMDSTALRESIKKNKPDVLIHTAAAVNVDACEENPGMADRLNTDLTHTLAEICKEYHIKLIYISTDAVFDGGDHKLYTEEDIPNPINYYGKTKLSSEKFVLEQEKNLVLRTNIYGFNVQEKKSFGEWILYSLMEDQTLTMFDDVRFSPILVDELAALMMKMIDCDLAGLYHACGTGSMTKYDFACNLKREFGLNCGTIVVAKSDEFSFKAKRAKDMGMSNHSICEILHTHISSPLESIIEFKRKYDEGLPQKLRNCRYSDDEN